MDHYRIYLIDNEGHIASGSGATCDTDQDACAQAQQMLDSSDENWAEVWTGTRCVSRIAATPTPVSPEQLRYIPTMCR